LQKLIPEEHLKKNLKNKSVLVGHRSVLFCYGCCIYTYTYTYMQVKKRWDGKTIVDLFADEFRQRPHEYYVCAGASS
jgi:hypothetical protein